MPCDIIHCGRKDANVRYNLCIALVVLIVAVFAGTPGAGEIDPQAIDSYLKGLFLEARYDLVHAYSFYSYADRQAPNNERITLRLAYVTLKMGDHEKARLYADRLIELGRFETDAQMILTEIDYKQGNNAAALERLLKLRERDDVEQFEVLKLLARVYLELERVDDAKKALEEANAIFSGDLFVHYRLGFIYMDSGEIDKAIQAFENAIEISPGLASAHLALASLLRHAGRTEEAKRAYVSALQLEPANQTAFREFMDFLVENEDYTAGIEFLEPLYEEGGLEQGGELTLGNLYYRSGRVEDAKRVFERVTEKHGENPFLLRILSDIEMESGNLHTAYTYLTKLVAAEPDSFTHYIGLLLIADGLVGNPSGPQEEVHMPEEEVLHYLERAEATLDIESAEENYFLGLLHRRRGNLDKAEVFLLRAERLDPGERRTAVELASLFEDRGQFDEALERIIPQHERYPEDVSLMNFYGYLLAEKGADLVRAEGLLREALQREPENGYFLDSLGWIKFKQADYGTALGILQRATGLVGNDAVIWEHLGDTYRKLGRVTEAVEAYRKSLGADPARDAVKDKLHEIEPGANPSEK